MVKHKGKVKRIKLLVCPQKLCFHWLEEGDSFASGLHDNPKVGLEKSEHVSEAGCGCSFGLCTRNPKVTGERDWFEPCEPAIESEIDEMILSGVSGFWDDCSTTPPFSNLEQFKRDCFIVARKTKCKVKEFNFSLLGRNFITCSFEDNGLLTYCLLNVHYPLISFASTVEPFNIKFIDSEVLQREFSDSYKVLTSEALSRPITHGTLHNLNSAELKQMDYWKPTTIAELIFNYWD